MIRRAVAVAIAALIVCQTPAARAQVLIYEVFSAYLDSLREQAGIPGLAAVLVDRDGIVWERAYGYEDLGSARAARTDTTFHADGLTQLLTTVMVLRCVEQGRLSLDDQAGLFSSETPEPAATLRHLLSHTTGPADGLAYAYNPERLMPLWRAARVCMEDSYRESLANLLVQLGMYESVPGANILGVVPPAEGVPDPADLDRYESLLTRRAMPYAVDERNRAYQSSYSPASSILTPYSGLVTTARDLAKFDTGLKQGLLVSEEMLDLAWTPIMGGDGLLLPHGLGWFVQSYQGEKVVWQFGMTEGASSSVMISLPNRRLTLILMANSDRLVRFYSPTAGDVSISPFGRLFLNLFVR